MRRLDIEPFGIPVGKVVDAYPTAAREIEVRLSARCSRSPSTLVQASQMGGVCFITAPPRCAPPTTTTTPLGTVLQEAKLRGGVIYIKSQDGNKYSDVVFSRKIDP
jgi:hypothetical protein